MRVREAKDFLVQQAAEQAALENVPFSDLEKRVMYFTEAGDCPEDPIALNDAFEAEYNSAVYEKKISRLMAQVYHRIRQRGPERLRLWKEAVRTLRKGDHYILVFLPQSMPEKSARMWPIYIFAALVAAGSYALLIFFFG